MMRGNSIRKFPPKPPRVLVSDGFTPETWIRTRTCPISGSGSGISPATSTSRAGPFLSNQTALMAVVRFYLWRLLLRRIAGSAGSRGAEEELLAVGESHVAAVGLVGSVLSLIAVDDDFGSRRDGSLRHPAAQQRVRGAAFDHPVGHFAVGVLDIDVNPGMGIDPFHLGDGSAQLHWLAGVE